MSYGTVPNLSIIIMLLNIIIGIAMPVVLFIYFRKKYKCDIKPFLLGAATFFIFAMVLEQIVHSVALSGNTGKVIQNNIWLYALYGGSMAALFEETGRLIVMKFFLKKDIQKEKNAMMFGAGHGGMEVILIFVMAMVSNIVLSAMINSGAMELLIPELPSDAISQFNALTESLTNTAPWVYLMGVVERVSAVVAHIGFSILVWKAVKEKKNIYYFESLAFHFLLDAITVVAAKYIENVIVVEVIIFICAVGIVAFAWYVSKNKIGGETAVEVIKVKQLKPYLYLLDDNGESTGYLLIGEEKACLIDTMVAGEDLKAVVRRYTDKPIVVVNTHGHPDHIYGNIFFDKAYMNLKDLELANGFINDSEFKDLCQKKNLSMPPFEDIHEGDVIDLGGRTLEIYDLPGHTQGGIVLLFKEDRILFTGDSINHHLWMQLSGCSTIEAYADAVERIMFLENEADVILHGHAHDYDDISLMRAIYNGARELCEGKTEADSEYKWFGGVDCMHPFEVPADKHFQQDDHVICYRKDFIR